MSILETKGKGYRELIASYKTIYLNTYNVLSLDIGVEDENLVIYRHESFQLWESECKGLVLAANKDFVTFNKSGMQALSLG